MGSNGMKRVGFEIRVGDDHGMSHPLEFPNVWNQYSPWVQSRGHTVRFSAGSGRVVCLSPLRSTQDLVPS